MPRALLLFLLALCSAVFGFECGISHSDDKLQPGNSRIVHGDASVDGAWPWVVVIEGLVGKQPKTRCTGAIVHPRWVLTAAHCIFNMSIRIGHGAADFERMKFVETSGVRVHPGYGYVSGRLRKDIAMYQLAEPLQFDNHTAPICLPMWIWPEPKTIAVATGFGIRFRRHLNETNEEEMVSPSQFAIDSKVTGKLHETFVQVSDTSLCRFLGMHPFWRNDFCTQGIGNGGLAGDSGGPLNMYQNGRWFHVGIASTAALVTLPGHRTETQARTSYTATATYCDWIAMVTEWEVRCAP